MASLIDRKRLLLLIATNHPGGLLACLYDRWLRPGYAPRMLHQPRLSDAPVREVLPLLCTGAVAHAYSSRRWIKPAAQRLVDGGSGKNSRAICFAFCTLAVSPWPITDAPVFSVGEVNAAETTRESASCFPPCQPAGSWAAISRCPEASTSHQANYLPVIAALSHSDPVAHP